MIRVDTSTPMNLSLAPKTDAEAKAQQLYVLIMTIQGECPMYRDFGISQDYLHLPVNAAQTAMTLAVTEALKKYLPTMELSKIDFVVESGVDGYIHPILEVIDRES